MTGFETDTKKDFDLEHVLATLQQCRQEDGTVLLGEYLDAYHELCRFFKLTGRLFGFVAKDLESKMDVLSAHRRGANKQHYHSVQSMIEHEVSNDVTKVKANLPSGSRTFLRLHWALEFILEFMSRLSKSTDDDQVSAMAAEVYADTLSHHHPWITQKMAALAMYFLPTRKELIEVMCKQDYTTVLRLLGQVVVAGKQIYDIANQLFEDHGLLKLA